MPNSTDSTNKQKASASSSSTHPSSPTQEERHESGLGDTALFKQLWPFLKPYWRSLLLSALLLPVVTGTLVLQPFIIQRALDGPVSQKDWQGLLTYGVVFLLFLGLHSLFRYLQLFISQQTGARIITDIRTGLYKHLQGLSPAFFQRTPTGKLVTRLTADVENLSEMLSSGGITMISDLLIIVATLAGCYVMNWQLAILITVMIPLMITVMEFFRRQSRQAYDDMRVKLAKINTFLEESLGGISLVQAYRREEHNLDLFEAVNANYLKSNQASVLFDSSYTASVDFLIHITLILLLGFGGWMVFYGDTFPFLQPVTGGELAAFFLFIQQIFNPIEEISEKYTVIQSGFSSVDKIAAVLMETPDVKTPEHPQQLSSSQGQLTFQNVSFHYRPGVPILKNLSFTIEAGQTVAIVGPSGAGKTTLVKLLTRFYDTIAGNILLDQTPIQQLDLTQLRQTILMIHQDDALFSRTIGENIAFSTEHLDEEKLKRAAHQANLWNRIQEKPQGFQTPVEEGGSNLSAGERQLILFARAFYHDPPVMILDEATSAVDPQTEALVQEALGRLMAGRTVLMIAHRLSTVESAHRILVIENGTLAESGTHTELLQLGGVYANFYEQQVHPQPSLHSPDSKASSLLEP